MFPIRDHNPSLRTPWVTRAIIAINVLVYLLTAPWAGNMTELLIRGALYPVAVTHGMWLYSLLTHMFLHASLMHVFGNMLFLWVFGDNLEDQLGHLRFLLFYLAGGLAAAGLQIAGAPDSILPMVGASGAIAAVLGGYLLLFPRAQIDVLFIFVIFFKVFTIPAFIVLSAWFGIQVLSELAVASGRGGVAYLAHIGGFLAGVGMILPLWRARGGTGFWTGTGGRPPHPGQSYRHTGIPRVPRRHRF